MDARARPHAELMRATLARGPVAPSAFRAALLEVPPGDRDAWVDVVFGLDGRHFDDGPSLPRGGVPYLPCPVDTVVRAVDAAALREDDVVVDVGSGVGRGALLMHFLTGAPAIGLEIQPELVQASRGLIAQFPSARVEVEEGDGAERLARLAQGTVFFFYCPFSGARAARAREGLAALARERALRVCCVDWPLPDCPWLEVRADLGELVVYQSVRPTE